VEGPWGQEEESHWLQRAEQGWGSWARGEGRGVWGAAAAWGQALPQPLRAPELLLHREPGWNPLESSLYTLEQSFSSYNTSVTQSAHPCNSVLPDLPVPAIFLRDPVPATRFTFVYLGIARPGFYTDSGNKQLFYIKY